MQQQLTDMERSELVDDVERCYDDFEYMSNNYLFIADKRKIVRPLIHSYTQKKMLMYILWVYFELGIQLRIIATKARRVMWTTLATSFIYWLMWKSERPDVAVMVGDKYETTDTIYRMYELLHRKNPYTKDVKSVETFEYLDSRAYCKFLSANSDRLGQSKGITHALLTEGPYYRDGNAVQLSLLNAIDDHPLTTCFIEGTGNGRDPFFYPKWVESIDHADEMCARYNANDLDDLLFNKRVWDGSFIPLFTAWHEVPEYRRDPELENVRTNNLDDDERAGMETYQWDEAQVAWRRYMIREKCGKDIATFNQEFPSCWKDAFKYSGGNRPWFGNTQLIDKYLDRTERLLKGKLKGARMYRVAMKWKVQPVYDIHGRCANIDKLQSVAYIPKGGANTADCWLLKTPKLGTHADRYCMGVDVAEGLAQRDYSVAWVYDRVAGEFVFLYRGHINHEDFHELIAMIGVYYGCAGVLVEHNNHGAGVIGNLKKIYPVSMILRDRKETKIARNAGVQTELRYGHYTDRFNKRDIAALLRSFIYNTPEGMLFHRFYIEAATFCESPDGKHLEAENKHRYPEVKTYDDCVMGAALTLRANELMSPPVRTAGYSRRERAIYGKEKFIVTNLRDI